MNYVAQKCIIIQAVHTSEALCASLRPRPHSLLCRRALDAAAATSCALRMQPVCLPQRLRPAVRMRLEHRRAGGLQATAWPSVVRGRSRALPCVGTGAEARPLPLHWRRLHQPLSRVRALAHLLQGWHLCPHRLDRLRLTIQGRVHR